MAHAVRFLLLSKVKEILSGHVLVCCFSYQLVTTPIRVVFPDSVSDCLTHLATTSVSSKCLVLLVHSSLPLLSLNLLRFRGLSWSSDEVPKLIFQDSEQDLPRSCVCTNSRNQIDEGWSVVFFERKGLVAT